MNWLESSFKSQLADGTPYSIFEIGEGDGAIDKTAAVMGNQISQSVFRPSIRKYAEYVVQNVKERDQYNMARAVYQFVKDRIRYTNDPVGMEYIQTPLELLRQISMNGYAFGDCDDMTVLGLSLLKSLGYETKLKVASYRPSQEFEHVYGLVNIRGQWMAFDCVKKEFVFGFEVANPTRTKEFDV